MAISKEQIERLSKTMIHAPSGPGARKALSREVHDFINAKIREANPDAPADAPVCGQCFAGAAFGAVVELLLDTDRDSDFELMNIQVGVAQNIEKLGHANRLLEGLLRARMAALEPGVLAELLSVLGEEMGEPAPRPNALGVLAERMKAGEGQGALLAGLIKVMAEAAAKPIEREKPPMRPDGRIRYA